MRLLHESCLLHIARAEVAIEVEPALAHSDAAVRRGEALQAVQSGLVQRGSLVRVHPRGAVHGTGGARGGVWRSRGESLRERQSRLAAGGAGAGDDDGPHLRMPGPPGSGEEGVGTAGVGGKWAVTGCGGGSAPQRPRRVR